jgi:actin-like ATPase involved in cell morphogenesis
MSVAGYVEWVSPQAESAPAIGTTYDVVDAGGDGVVVVVAGVLDVADVSLGEVVADDVLGVSLGGVETAIEVVRGGRATEPFDVVLVVSEGEHAKVTASTAIRASRAGRTRRADGTRSVSPRGTCCESPRSPPLSTTSTAPARSVPWSAVSGIVFADVTKLYPDAPPALDDFNLAIEAGELIGLV